MAHGEGVYRDRDDAGERLAALLGELGRRRPVVLAIPNGGVPVALRVRDRLAADFGVLVVRKLHIPWNREAGFGAVAPDGTVVFNEPLRRSLLLSAAEERAVIEEERRDIERRMRRYGSPPPPLAGRATVLVDDGLASGFSMLAAARFARRQAPGALVVAVPTASEHAVALLGPEVDRVVCPNVRGGPVFAVADAYREWRDLGEDEVASMLRARPGP